jgi:hypothetical protein
MRPASLRKRLLFSRGVARGGIRWWAFSLFTLALGACSFTYDADRKQCSANADCVALGVTNGACVDGLCQQSMQETPEASTGVSVGLVGAADAAQSPRDGASSDALLPSPGFSESQFRDGSLGDAGLAAQPGLDAEIDPRDTGRGADGQTICVGSSCPECNNNADCEQRGMLGGTCADGFCWSPAAQCAADADCLGLGPEYSGGRCLVSQCRPNPRWRCEHPASVSGPGTKTLTSLVRDSLSLNPLVGIRALVCPKLDLQCTAPIGEATTKADGILSFTVPATFAGYLKVEDAKYFPAMYALPAAFPMDGVLQPFPLLGAGLIVDALAITLGTGLDARRGHMMLIAEDCMGNALSGVAFKSPQQDARTVQFYVRDLLPSTSASQTAEIGNGGYLNFPAGAAVITLEQVASTLKLNTVSVVVRAGYISVAYVRPELR